MSDVCKGFAFRKAIGITSAVVSLFSGVAGRIENVEPRRESSIKIKLYTIAMLMLLIVALPAGAVIQATSVEIRGSVVTGTAEQLWDATNFAGFWYDLKDDLKTESLEISSPILGRDIQDNTLWYNTTRTTKTLKLYDNQPGAFDAGDLSKFTAGPGKYSILGWQGQPYVAVKDKAKKLAKLVIEQGNATSEKKSLTVGETWNIGDGWTLTAQNINASASPGEAWLVLSKDGVKKDDKIIGQGKAYVYIEKSFGGESDVPLFVTYVDSVFPGATSDMVQLRYTWAIGTSITEVKSTDVYGNMEVMSASDDVLSLNNKDRTISLSKDTLTDVMGEIKFRVADSDTLRYYPAVVRTEPGMYEVRGSVVTGTAEQLWNATNFAGFWYDLKDDLKTESLEISSPIIGRDIQDNTLFYNTSRTTKTLKLYDNQPYAFDYFDLSKFTAGTGKYSILGWQGQPYVAVKDKAKKLAKLVIEQGNATSEKKSLTVGETWDIGDGWTLKAQSIDAKASPRQAWLVLSKDGVKKDDKVIGQGKAYVYIENSFAGESDVPLFVTYVDSVFAGATSDMVQLRYTWAIGTSVTEVKSADVFGNMEVRSASDDLLSLNNKDRTISLSKDTLSDVMGEIKFKVADSDTLRYYPMVQYQISAPPPPPPPPSPFDTLKFEPNNWNLISVPKTLNNSAVDVAFSNLSFDTNNIKWYYNTSTQAWEHPSSIAPLSGYWVYNNASNQLYQKLWYKNMAGPNVPPSMLLKAGWNLIGHTSTTNMTVQSALISIDGKYSHLLTYSPADGWKMYIVGNPYFQQFNVFEPGRGYWIFITQDATYAAVEV